MSRTTRRRRSLTTTLALALLPTCALTWMWFTPAASTTSGPSTSSAPSSQSSSTQSSSGRSTTTRFATAQADTDRTPDRSGAGRTLSTETATRQQLATPWLTTGDQQHLLERQDDVTFRPGDGTGSTIAVDDGVRYQRMDGFGASFTDSSAWLVANELDDDARSKLMTALFDRSDGIGLGLLRQPMGASDFIAGDQHYSYDDTCCELSDFSIAHDREYLIPTLRQAMRLNPDLKVMATPWSPPGWMKTSDALQGGSLKPESYEIWADYFVRYIQAYAAEGIDIQAVTVQNEPQHETTSYPSMLMSPEEQATAVATALGPAFEENGLETDILAWDHNWDDPRYPITVLDDPSANPYIAGSAFHCYAGDVGAQSQVHEAHPDKGLWFTECSGGEWSPDFGDNLVWNTQNLIIGSVRNWARGVTLWNMALDQNHGPTAGGCTDCRGVVTIDTETGQVDYNVEYYVLGHVAKFVRPGAERIESSTHPGELESVAFRNPDGSIVLLALNPSEVGRTMNLRWQGQHLRYDLPAGAVVTMTWNGS